MSLDLSQWLFASILRKQRKLNKQGSMFLYTRGRLLLCGSFENRYRLSLLAIYEFGALDTMREICNSYNLD